MLFVLAGWNKQCNVVSAWAVEYEKVVSGRSLYRIDTLIREGKK